MKKKCHLLLFQVILKDTKNNTRQDANGFFVVIAPKQGGEFHFAFDTIFLPNSI